MKWPTDNQGAMYMIPSGSRKEHLQDGAIAIFSFILHRINLEIDWIPHSLNEYANAISRIVDYDNWSLNPSVFSFIDASWGPHTVDCFASPYNIITKLRDFTAASGHLAVRQ